MKLFELVLYQSCNYKCRDCPLANWIYKVDEKFEDGHPKNAITNERLIPWIEKYLDSEEWFIEITGGEPGLYPEIFELVSWLANHNYKGIIRTNGSCKIPGRYSFKRVATWHEDKDFPKYYDYILILEDPKDDWKSKQQYCIDKNIPHVVFPYINFSTDGKKTTNYDSNPVKWFTKMTTMFSSGSLTGCFTGSADHKGKSLFNMSPPVLQDVCYYCGNIEAIEYFIENIPEFREYIGLSETFKRREKPVQSRVSLPALTAENKWVDESGKIWGVLGDDVNKINENYNRYVKSLEGVK